MTTMTRTTITLPRSVLQQLKIQAVMEKTTLSELVNKAVAMFYNPTIVKDSAPWTKKVAGSHTWDDAEEYIKNERNSWE